MKRLSLMLLLLAPAVSQAQIPPGQCPAACAQFNGEVQRERKEWIERGWIYIAPGDPRTFLAIRTVSTGSALPPIDDELYITDRYYDLSSGASLNKELWRVNYPGANGNLARWGAATLPKGRNETLLIYANTQSPDAHFFAEVGGVAWCGSDTQCRTYREGLTFGSGIVNRILSQSGGRGVVLASNIYNSNLQPPPGCTCGPAVRTDFNFEPPIDLPALLEMNKARSAAPPSQ